MVCVRTPIFIIIIPVLSAKRCMAVDTNGLSDPYVIVELVPVMYFRDSSAPVKTKVIAKSLNPIYEETFEL